MHSPREFIEALTELGLNTYEAKVYFTLVSEGLTTAKHLSEITGIPYGKVYEIMNSLASKGFAMLLPSKPIKCRAASPREVLEATRKKMEEKYQHLEKQVISKLEPLFTEAKEANEPSIAVWMITGRANNNKKIEELFRKAKKQINIYLTENGFSRLVFQKDQLQDAKERGVVINILVPASKRITEDIKSLNFCNIKHNPNIVQHIFTIDSKHTLFIEPIPDDDEILYGRDIGFWIISEKFTGLANKMFQFEFAKAKYIQLKD